jgi:hypothetical protein
VTSIHTYDPTTAPTALPALPPLPLGALAVGVANLLQDAAQLPQPRYIALFDPEQISIQFPPVQPSMTAITRWARRFGGVVITETRHGQDGPETWCRTTFSYYGVAVQAYARIPAGPGQQLTDQENPHA